MASHFPRAGAAPSGNGSADSESELEMKAKQRRGGDGRHLRRAAQQVLDR
jgi:hypothetical protein